MHSPQHIQPKLTRSCSGEKILRPGDTTQITRVGDNLVCEVKLNSGKKELLPIVYFTRPYEAPILKKVGMGMLGLYFS